MIDQTLLDEAQCYVCLGMSIAEAIELALLARISGGGSGGLGAGFTSGLIDANTSPALKTVAHGLGSVPRIVRAVMVCIVNDPGVGVNAGGELAVEGVWAQVDGVPNFTVWADATTLYMFNDAVRPGGEGDVYGPGASNFTSFANWKFKFYAFK